MSPYKHNYGQSITTDAEGVSVDRAFLAHINIPNALAADSDAMADGIATTTGVGAVPTVISTFANQPDYPRNIVVVVAATTAGHVAAGNIVVKGLNAAGVEITETHEVTVDTPATFTGALAFASVISVTVPVQDGASVTIDVGWGSVLGLNYMLKLNTVLKVFFNGTEESTAPTYVLDADEVEKNTFVLNSTPDGLKDIDIYLMV